MRILITGGCGFIGSHLSEQLIKEKHNITVIDNLANGRLKNIENINKNSRFKFIRADILNYSKIDNYFKNIDAVIHLAALADIVPSIDNPEKYFRVNVEGTINILNLCRKHRIKKIIYAASSSSYGIPKRYPTNENEIINPLYPYALTKYMGEELVLHWGKLYKFDAISLRFFNVYGPRSRTTGTYGAVFGIFLAQKIGNKPFTVVGNGKQTRDFTYVTDIVSSISAALKSKIKNDYINIGSGKTYSINLLVKLLGGKKIYIPKRPGEPDCTWADIKKAKKLLKWKPKIKLEDGVELMLKNIEWWNDAPLWTPNKIKKATKNWFKYVKK